MDRLNQWLTLLANLGVIAGLIFVGIEVRQNTLAIERELNTSFADNVHGRLSDSDYLAPIVTKIMAKELDFEMLAELKNEYELTDIEAQRWWRHLMQIWLRYQADWVYRGRAVNDCQHERFLMEFQDNQLLMKHSADQFEAGFVACVQG